VKIARRKVQKGKGRREMVNRIRMERRKKKRNVIFRTIQKKLK